MSIQTTTQQRINYAPACKLHGLDFLEAYQAKDMVFKFWGYRTDKSYTGCYACRAITGGTGYTLHAYRDNNTFHHWDGTKVSPLALAEDVNASQNPYGKRLVTDRPRGMVDDLQAIRTNSGAQIFRWGGYYSGNKDAMHDDIVCKPSDLASGINWNTVRGYNSTPTPPVEVQEPEEFEVKSVFMTCRGAFDTANDRRGEWPGNTIPNADGTLGIAGMVFMTDGLDIRYMASWEPSPGKGDAKDMVRLGLAESLTMTEESPNTIFNIITNGGINPAALEAYPSLAGTTPSTATPYAKQRMAEHNKKMGRPADYSEQMFSQHQQKA